MILLILFVLLFSDIVFALKIFIAIVLLIFDVMIAMKFQEIAEMKGYEKNYFWYCFLSEVIGALLVIALPDKNIYEMLKAKSNENQLPQKEMLESKIVNQMNQKETTDKEFDQQPDKMKVKVTMYIDASLCVGCGKCSAVCPNDAIDGNVLEIHKINSNCMECGLCVEQCSFNAIKE